MKNHSTKLAHLALIITVYLFNTVSLSAQLKGRIIDNEGEPLPYATIYVKESFQGTTSNEDGQFEMKLKSGKHNLVFQYVGYQQQIQVIDISEDRITEIETILIPDAVKLDQVTIAADAEDPAYEIIRQAIKKRKIHQKEIEQYSSEIYIKGLVRVADAPEKFLGFNIGDMEGILDSTRQGIVYLSESKSKIYFEAPDKLKEVMIASKVAGDMDAISFNQYSDVSFSFYDEFIRFNRNLISPIADNALRYYKYRLESSEFDKYGNLINKIKVMPKHQSDPVFSGYIYIIENSWRIHSTDLKTDGVAAKNRIFDQLAFKQIYVPIEDGTRWALFSQIMDFSVGVATFKFNGTYSYFFSEYDMNPIPEGIFNKEIFLAEPDANKRSTAYWDSIRPVPITLEENKDYRKKDSLEILWDSKAYRDSIDRVDNKFKPMNVLLGYTYAQSHKKRYFTYTSPINSVLFNAVQGYNINVDFSVRQWNKEETGFFSITPKVNYGFSEKKFRPELEIKRRFNAINYPELTVGVGRQVSQINTSQPMSVWWNSIESLLYKNHFVKLYEADYIRLEFQREWNAGIRSEFRLKFQERNPLFINTQRSLRRKELDYVSNNPWIPNEFQNPAFESNKIAVFQANFIFRPKQKYSTFGRERYRSRSNWPDLFLNYKKGVALDSEGINFDFLNIGVRDRRMDMNLWGYLAFSLDAGIFLSKENLGFLDRYHFNGNQSNVILNPNALNRFLLIPDYTLSTDDQFARLIVEQHLEGKLIDRIPLLRKTPLKSIIGYKHLETPEGRHQELLFGLENFSIGGIPIIRLDWSWNLKKGSNRNMGVYVSLVQDLN